MRIDRTTLRRMILKEMLDIGVGDEGVLRKDFYMAAQNIGNLLHGMGVETKSEILKYFNNLIKTDKDSPESVNRVINPGMYGIETASAGFEIMNVLRALGLSLTSPSSDIKLPGYPLNMGKFNQKLDAFADEVFRNIESRNRY